MKKLILFFSIILFSNPGFSQNSVENLGSRINSKNSEIRPVLSFDGKTLYFVVESTQDNKQNQEIWYTELNSDGSWSQAVKCTEPLNSVKVDNAVFWASSDGSKIFFFSKAYQ